MNKTFNRHSVIKIRMYHRLLCHKLDEFKLPGIVHSRYFGSIKIKCEIMIPIV